MSAPAETLAALDRLGGPALRAGLAAVETRLRELLEASSPALETIEAGGKRVRPLLVFVAGMPAGDDPRLVRAAAAVELVHAATLVHDDVLDAAALRRGRPTVFAQGGRELATATGDLLFSRAFAELAVNDDPGQLRVLSSAAVALAEGELLQREDAWSAEVSEDRYLRRCALKTASLFEAACELGTAIGGGPDLVPFGAAIGLAFQLLDDVLDFTGPTGTLGKTRGADLLDGTYTLPMLIARQRSAELAALDLRSITAAEEICDRVVATGATDEVRARALTMVAEAKASLPRGLDASQREALELIADGVVERYS